MKRSLFFLISAIIAVIFGGMMFLAPAKAADGFGVAASPEAIILFRALGAMILSTGIMNFLVRNHPDSDTLKMVLLTNVFTHGLSMIADLWGVSDGVLTLAKVLPGQIAHLFVGVGSLIYLMKIK